MDDAVLAQRFGLIEERLRTLYEHLGIPYTDELPGEVVDLAQAGNKTEAISRLRQLTGMTLLEATRAVEALGR